MLGRRPRVALIANPMMAVATTIIGFALKATLGLRPNTEVERQDLDVTEHGEEGYVL